MSKSFSRTLESEALDSGAFELMEDALELLDIAGSQHAAALLDAAICAVPSPAHGPPRERRHLPAELVDAGASVIPHLAATDLR